jgi:toxin ParE1/3/4
VTVLSSRQAIERLVDIRDCLRRFNPDAAGKVADAIVDAGDALEIFPRRHPLRARGFHEFVEPRYSYVIRYDVVGPDVVILDVFHRAENRTKR